MIIEALKESLEHSLEIAVLVLLMMGIVDYFNVRTRGLLTNVIREKKWRPYILASLLGAIPGCFGSFVSVTLYVHGALGFGAIVGTMVASSGDAAYVMLSMIPKTALLLFGLLFILGIAAGLISEYVSKKIKFQPCEECHLQEYHANEKSVKHYFREHLWQHIIKEHLWRIFLWMFFILFAINVLLQFWDVENFVRSNLIWVFFLSALIGLIPDSGPHIIFVVLFAKGLVPFSVLLTSSISQDGHGVLPLLSYSVRDTVYLKLYNLIFAVLIGGLFYTLGL